LQVEVVQSLNLIQIQRGLDFKKDLKIRKDFLFSIPVMGRTPIFPEEAQSTSPLLILTWTSARPALHQPGLLRPHNTGAESELSLSCHQENLSPFLLSSTESTSDQNVSHVELESAPITSSREKKPYKISRSGQIFVQTELQTLSGALAHHRATCDLPTPNHHRPGYLQKTSHLFDYFAPPATP
jgi:hypothetical protein